MGTPFTCLSRLLVVALLLSAQAVAEHAGGAAALGLEDSPVAAAVESGVGRPWNQTERANDPTIQKMNAETSYFLQNAPRPVAAVEIAAPKKINLEAERDLALQQVDFRQNVEGAMKQILSFSPAAQVNPPVEEAPVETAPLTARERLVRSLNGTHLLPALGRK